MLTQAKLKEMFSYDPETGVFTRLKTSKHNTYLIGKSAGSLNSAGYLQIGINWKAYVCHRLAYLYMTGKWPKTQIDHINCIKNDNRWCNLREASQSENHKNVGIRKDNSSGFKGVGWHADVQKWRARCVLNKKSYFLGHFDDVNLAAKAYQAFAQKYHGEFYRG